MWLVITVSHSCYHVTCVRSLVAHPMPHFQARVFSLLGALNEVLCTHIPEEYCHWFLERAFFLDATLKKEGLIEQQMLLLSLEG